MPEWKQLVTEDMLSDQGSSSYRADALCGFSWFASSGDRNDGELRLVYPNYDYNMELYQDRDLGSSFSGTITVCPMDVVSGMFFQVPFTQILAERMFISISSKRAYDNSTGMKYAVYSADIPNLNTTLGDTDWDDTTGITLTKRSSTFSGTWSSIDHATGGGLITNNHTFPLGFGTYYPSMHTGLYIIFQEDMSDTTSLSNDYQAKVVMRYYVTGV